MTGTWNLQWKDNSSLSLPVAEEYEEFIAIDWKPNPSRGCSYFYGYRAVHQFLETV
jgi:hypothetical protein